MLGLRSRSVLPVLVVAVACGPLVALDDLAVFPQHLASGITLVPKANAYSTEPGASDPDLVPTVLPSGAGVFFSISIASDSLLQYVLHAARMTAGPVGQPPRFDIRNDNLPAGPFLTSETGCWPLAGAPVIGPEGEVWVFTFEVWTSLGRALAEYEVRIGQAFEGDHSDSAGCPLLTPVVSGS